MFSKHVRSWLLASAITVLFAVVLLTVAFPTPAEARGGWMCQSYDPNDGCVSYFNGPACHDVRAACRDGYEGYRKRVNTDIWEPMCGSEPLKCSYRVGL